MQNAGFSVQRRSAGGIAWGDLTFIPANAHEGEGGDYEYTDNTASDLPAGAQLAYRLRQLDYDGTESYSDIVEVALSHAPLREREQHRSDLGPHRRQRRARPSRHVPIASRKPRCECRQDGDGAVKNRGVNLQGVTNC